eukprot:9221499-Heterocapsa_arctica.AAC.1
MAPSTAALKRSELSTSPCWTPRCMSKGLLPCTFAVCTSYICQRFLLSKPSIADTDVATQPQNVPWHRIVAEMGQPG